MVTRTASEDQRHTLNAVRFAIWMTKRFQPPMDPLEFGGDWGNLVSAINQQNGETVRKLVRQLFGADMGSQRIEEAILAEFEEWALMESIRDKHKRKGLSTQSTDEAWQQRRIGKWTAFKETLNPSMMDRTDGNNGTDSK